MKPPRISVVPVISIGILLAVGGAACDRYGPTIDIDGRRPQKLEGTLHVSWGIVRMPVYAPVACDAAGARYVLAVMETGSPRTYRMSCDLPAREAWIPIEPGDQMLRAELMDSSGERIAMTADLRLEGRKANDALEIPLVFGIK